jgi:alkylation response protein AidB-like acyl-CoA dehydrogenase
MSLKICSKPIGLVDEHFVEEARAFAEKYIEPNAEGWEMNHEQPEKTMRSAIKEFTRLVVPKDLGGVGATISTRVRVLEEWAKVDLGFTFAWGVHNNITYGVYQTQNKSLRDRYLPKMISGEIICSFLLTEPGVGTDAAAIKTRAEQKDGKWVINGDKSWVTNSSNADLFIVFAQTSEGAGAKGIIGFLFDSNLKGVERKKPYDMMGCHAMIPADVSFSNCTVDADSVAFPVGIGFKAAMAAIDIARLGVGSMCNGVLQGCLETAIEYIKERKAFGAPLIKQQGLQFKLADVVTQLEASRMLNFQAAIALEKGENATLLCAHTKKFASRAAWEGAHHAMEVMGANGLKREYKLARQLTALGVTPYTDGTNEVCNMVIARSF